MWPGFSAPSGGPGAGVGGAGCPEITERLFIGTATVKTHINRIFAKIGVADRRGAIAYAVSRRLSTRGSPGAGPAT
jgi:hypothetical protein